jgi:hypothetical protein
MNNSRLWIRPKWGGGEGGRGGQREQGCTDRKHANNRFHHGAVLGMRICGLKEDYGAESAKPQALTRDVAYT